jgi:hypothetical protein
LFKLKTNVEEGGGHKERVKECEYTGCILYSCMKERRGR